MSSPNQNNNNKKCEQYYNVGSICLEVETFPKVPLEEVSSHITLVWVPKGEPKAFLKVYIVFQEHHRAWTVRSSLVPDSLLSALLDQMSH